jgi:two-component system LytT family sensor kinase
MLLLMTLHDFIFTKKRPGRYFRHIAFWLAQYVFWVFWATGFFIDLKNWWEYINWNIKLHGYFVLDMSYTYLVVYYFSPKYLITKRFLKFSIGVFILTIFTYILYILYRFWYEDLIQFPKVEQLRITWFFSMNFISIGPPVICAMFLTLKMLKNFYIKMEEKRSLTKENVDAEHQLLKAQIHPHFLFNTLNNIYSFSLNKSSKAGEMVLQLSDIMKYMINDCEDELVPLNIELKIIEDYIGLEKERYGNRLNMQIEIVGNYENKIIAPLLLIPFVENSFKHGTSQVLKDPWIKLFIQADEDVLHFTLTNSKPTDETVHKKHGIGLKNVKKRLALLYPEKHYLQIESTAHTFTVNMQIPLEQKKNISDLKHAETHNA